MRNCAAPKVIVGIIISFFIFVRRCGSVIFVQLPFITRAAPNFVSDPDPLVLKAYTPAYVQSQIDLLKRQKKFTEKLVLEKPKLPPKKTGEDPSKGSSAQDLLKGQADPVPQLLHHLQILLLLPVMEPDQKILSQ